jgi:tripartite-type tricarboxylate transporter receptor subunit TctC
MKTSLRKAATPRCQPVPRGNEGRLVTHHSRRRILSLAAGAVALPTFTRMAKGQAYPTRPVRIIVVKLPNVVEVNPSVPSKTLPELIAYAKANPGKINMASGGVGVSGHMAGELFKAMTGINMVHVPYRGSAPALTDLIGGQVQVMFEPPPASIGYINAGKLRALAVTTATRSELLPDIPTVGDFVPGYEASSWYGVGAPKNTPIEIVDRLNKEINAALADPKMKARLADLGGTPLPGPPAGFGKLIAEETEKWAKVIREADIKAE